MRGRMALVTAPTMPRFPKITLPENVLQQIQPSLPYNKVVVVFRRKARRCVRFWYLTA